MTVTFISCEQSRKFLLIKDVSTMIKYPRIKTAYGVNENIETTNLHLWNSWLELAVTYNFNGLTSQNSFFSIHVACTCFQTLGVLFSINISVTTVMFTSAHDWLDHTWTDNLTQYTLFFVFMNCQPAVLTQIFRNIVSYPLHAHEDQDFGILSADRV